MPMLIVPVNNSERTSGYNWGYYSWEISRSALRLWLLSSVIGALKCTGVCCLQLNEPLPKKLTHQIVMVWAKGQFVVSAILTPL